jgi:hypothetical protein
VLLEKENGPLERKALTAGNGFVIKFDFAGQLFATEYSPAGKRAGAQVPNRVHDSLLRIDPLGRPSEKTLKLLVDRLIRFR